MKPFHLNTHELPHRAGEMKEYHLRITPPEKIGTELIGVDSEVELDARLESVEEGILITGEVRARAVGECSRCLDPVVVDIKQSIQELFHYKPQRDSGDLDDDDLLLMEGDVMDLETPIRDAIILNLPINPVCAPECEGLCPECGIKWSQLPPEHEHELLDARWSGLEALKKSLEER